MPDGEAPGGKGFKMGDAYVDVHIDGAKAAKQGADELKKGKADFDKAGEEVGDSAGEKAGKSMAASTKKKAKKGLEDAADEIGDEAGKKVGDKMGDSAVKSAKKKVDKEGSSLGKWMAISIFGGLPAAAQIAGAAAGLALAGAGTFVVGLAALATSQNQAVQASYNRLWGTIRDGTVNAAAPLADEFARAANEINTELAGMTGSFQKMFHAAEPGVGALKDGLMGLVRESLPGVITATEQSGDAFKGLSSLLTDTGKGLGLFFTNSATAAQSSGVILASFGRIIRDLLGFAGAFFAQLSNTGSGAAVRFEQVLHQLENTLLRLGTGAFPVMFAAAGMMLNVFSGLLSVISQFAPVLGPVTGALLSFVAVAKIMNLLTFGKLASEFALVKTSIKEADGVRGKFSAGMGILGSGFGIAAVAAIGVTAVLGMLGQQQQETAKKTQEHESRVDSLASALRNSKGAIDANVRATAAQELANMKLTGAGNNVLEMAKYVGLNVGTVTDAYLGNAAAQKQVTAAIDAMIPKTKEQQDAINNGSDADKKRLGWALLLHNAFNDTNSELGQAITKNKLYAEATEGTNTQLENMRGATDRQKQANDNLRAAFVTLADPMGTVATRGQAIADAFDRMTGRQPDLEETTKNWHQFMDDLKATKFEDAAHGTKKWAAALVDAQGHINTTTKDGRTLYDVVQGGRKNFDDLAAAMGKAGVPADEMTKRLQAMRDELVNTLIKMGFTKTEAEAMANQFGLLPKDVSILMSTGGTISATTAEVMILGGKLQGLPPHTPVVVDAITDQAKTQLQNLGIQVTTMPNGQTKIEADTAAAAKNLEDFMWYWHRRQLNIPVVVNLPQGSSLINVHGGLPAAAEGTDYAPGGWTLVGERGPEIVSIPRGSQVYTNAETQRMLSGHLGSGNDGASLPMIPTSTSSAPGGAGGGDTYVTNNFYNTFPQMPDPNALVEMVSRRFEQRMRQSRGA